ncbi:Gfo/Idh/MocA family oxidoreductase [Thalassospiraceae bacterium LMO-JJ14]|nr:Gfo/Idh/MocA family oxidoreductase [Thalassospiraceae bacterium LMO-JJ14]
MIRCGVAGLGRWGRVLIDSVQGKSDKITVTAGVTGRKNLAVEYCTDKGIDLRDDFAELLNDSDIDAIVLATPHTQHVDQIIAAAKAGKPVFCDKPLALTAADARRAADAMQAANLPLCVGFNRRFLPAMIKLRELATSGALGTLLHIEGNISGGGGLRYGPEHWRASETESPAGGMTAMGVHMMDAMMSICGHVEQLRAVSERRATPVPVDDTTFATLKFHSGVTGVLTTLFATHLLWRIQVFGSKGWAEVRDQDILEVRLLDGDNTREDFSGFDMERAELEAFADTLTDGMPYPVPIEDAIHGIAILEAVVEASKTGNAVKPG